MSLAAACFLVNLAGTYFGLGFLFALVFLTWGVERIDPAARKMPLLARLVIMPGVTALWPILLVRALRRGQPPVT